VGHNVPFFVPTFTTRFPGMENEHIVSSFIYVSHSSNHHIASRTDFTQSTMTAKTSLRHDWRSEDQRVSQNTTDKMTRTVCMFSMGWIGNSISPSSSSTNLLRPPPASTSEDRCLQELGSVETIQGRCVAFPNVYQHQVQPFRLEDPTKPGVRKIFVAFLVDPTHTIPSATTVAPQQREIIREAMLAWITRRGWAGSLLN
jgi:hypothetical protein